MDDAQSRDCLVCYPDRCTCGSGNVSKPARKKGPPRKDGKASQGASGPAPKVRNADRSPDAGRSSPAVHAGQSRVRPVDQEEEGLKEALRILVSHGLIGAESYREHSRLIPIDKERADFLRDYAKDWRWDLDEIGVNDD